ncbi:flagellar export chaperone FliS [Paenibacillus xylaniclasticus]|uniref:flagellar export chaperone FliS n=1 Tax=Paenibacillus xylaniclasticus TaxID=588083 RepID=UPI000FD8238B|nr:MULTISPECIES: flagellar export chaperone FliS [Paenibacillus]GFN32651.1 flagellar protein FliS [Paenibacillus curdlanolyticus]
MQQAQNSYMQTKVQTSTPGQLTLMLYNGCLKFIKLAIMCIEKRDYEGKHVNFVKAQNIIEELQSTLNMEYDLSLQLSSLYTFINEKLAEANVKQDIKAAEDCIRLVTELRDVWAEALKELGQGGMAASV